MADRAVSDDDSPESIVDLFNDDRWQARLEEARARREVALREKGKDPSSAPKRKLMPWEKEAASDADFTVEPIIQAPDSDRVDFADRVDKVRETIKDEATPDTDTPPDELTAARSRSTARSTPSPLPTSFEDLLTDAAFEDEIEDEPNWAPPPKKRHSAIHEDAPDVIELASRYASTLSPGANAGSVDVFSQDDEVAETVAAAPVIATNNPPALLIVGILALAVMPFTMTVPPLERGPAMPEVPALRFQPALGFTTAMLWRPAETSATDWTPATTWSLPLATVFSPTAPSFQTQFDALAQPAFGQGAPEFLAPSAEVGTPRSVQPAKLNGAAIDRLPGAFSRRPVARPLPGESVADTRAPVRQPEVASGNETSPRVAPTLEPEDTLLDQITDLTSVLYDSAPIDADPAPEPLAPPQTVLQLTILVPSRAESSVADLFAADAADRGHTITSIKDVDVSISARNLRYFHDTDRAEAERLAAAYDAEARSFTWFSPKPAQGTVELWLEGRATAPRVAPVVRKAAPEPTAVAPQPTIVIVQKQEGLFSRLLGGHRVGTAPTTTSSSSSQTVTAAPAPAAEDTGTGTETGTDTGSDTGTGATTGTGGTSETTTGTGTGGTSSTGGTDDDTTSGTTGGSSGGTTSGSDTGGTTGDTSGDTSGTTGGTTSGGTSGSSGATDP